MNSHNGQIYMMQKGSKPQILNAFLPILLSCNSKHMFVGLFWGDNGAPECSNGSIVL